MPDFNRKRLQHGMPNWVRDGEIYFITINGKQRGINILARPDKTAAIKEAIQHYCDLGKWWPRLIVIMPDHLHALLSLNTAQLSIKQIISPWKSYLSKTRGID